MLRKGKRQNFAAELANGSVLLDSHAAAVILNTTSTHYAPANLSGWAGVGSQVPEIISW